MRTRAFIRSLGSTPAGRMRLYTAFCALVESDVWTSFDKRPRSIAVANVLSEAWREDRLERALRLLAEGQRAPAIDVVRFDLTCGSWYGVSDGMHRTEAARATGRTRITAAVGGAYRIEISRYTIRREYEGERLYYRRAPDDYRFSEIADDTATILVGLGVYRAPSTAPDVASAASAH